jgi:hypothetical protein
MEKLSDNIIYIDTNFQNIRNDPNIIFRGFGEDDSRKKPVAKNLVLTSTTRGILWQRCNPEAMLKDTLSVKAPTPPGPLTCPGSCWT